MAQAAGTAVPQQVVMAPAVDLSPYEALDVVIYKLSNIKIIDENRPLVPLGGVGGQSTVRGECTIINGTRDVVLRLCYQSSDRVQRQFSAELKSADGNTVLAQFERPPAGLDTVGILNPLSAFTQAPPIQIWVGGVHYATVVGGGGIGSAVLQKSNVGCVQEGKGPSCICCGPFKENLDDFSGQTLVTKVTDNDSMCPCAPNTGQRCTMPLPKDPTTKLDVLLMQSCQFLARVTMHPSSSH